MNTTNKPGRESQKYWQAVFEVAHQPPCGVIPAELLKFSVFPANLSADLNSARRYLRDRETLAVSNDCEQKLSAARARLAEVSRPGYKSFSANADVARALADKLWCEHTRDRRLCAIRDAAVFCSMLQALGVDADQVVAVTEPAQGAVE